MFKGIGRSILIAALCAHLSGCVLLAGAAVGAGGVAWVKGRLQQDLNTSLEVTHRAVISGLKSMELPVVIDRKDAMTAKTESKFSDGTNVWIDLKYLTARSTRITIRVGVIGDQTRSQQILESIKRYL